MIFPNSKMKVATRIFLCVLILSLWRNGCLSQPPNHCNNENNWHSLESDETARRNCGAAFRNLCTCERVCYESKHSYVVNCTNTRFENEDQKILSMLPEKTEVLIMTGNYFHTLDWNIFGEEDRLPHLRVIDLSNNAIEEIHGKAFHHVRNVETLILDFNRMSVTEEKTHPRVFSNFESLRELHLTDAFEDRVDKDLGLTLYKIFINSNLTKLLKIHLEQNEIRDFKNKPAVFCALPSLMDIHLGDNKLDSLNKSKIDLSCVERLRFVDLRRNQFKSIVMEDIRNLDSLIRNKSSNQIQVDFLENPFECSCALNPFVNFIKKTKDRVRNSDLLKCKNPSHKSQVPFYETKNCGLKIKSTSWPHQKKSTGTTVLLCFLSFILICLIFALIYVQRSQLKKKLDPVIETVHKRVRYTSIATADGQEMSV